MKQKTPVLISACLLGINCRYDGTSSLNQTVIDYLNFKHLLPIPVCPEQLGGLSTPRGKAWFTKGDGRDYLDNAGQLTNEDNQNIGPAFLLGAQEVLKVAHVCDCQTAILKQRSPSCGSRQIYRNGKLVDGIGITCALLQCAGLEVVGEESLDQLK